MTAPREPDSLIRAVLEEGPTVLPDRVLDSALGEVHRTRQRAVLGPWRTLPMSMSRTALAAAVIVTAIAVGGTVLYVGARLGGVGDEASAPPSSPSVSSTVASGTPSPTPTASPPPSAFVATGDPTRDRSGHSATKLQDGRVLIAGGVSGEGPTNSAEIYDPRTGSFTATGSMGVPRDGHSALLLDDGRVLIAGGSRHDPMDLEIFDPAVGRFTETGSLTDESFGLWRLVRMVRLADGRIIAFGPAQGRPDTMVRELEPDGLRSTQVATISSCSGVTSAAALADGRVAVACNRVGDPHNTIRLFDPVTGRSAPLDVPAGDRVAQIVSLADGRVLFYDGSATYPEASSTNLNVYDADAGTVTKRGPLPFVSYMTTTTRLADGRILFVGDTQAVLWDPATGVAAQLPTIVRPPDRPSATVLDDGRVLIVGQTGAELFDPAAVP